MRYIKKSVPVVTLVIKAYMEGLNAEAKATNPNFTGFDAKRGEALLFSKHTGKKGTEMSCVTCHSSDLKKGGQNINTTPIVTGKQIGRAHV